MQLKTRASPVNNSTDVFITTDVTWSRWIHLRVHMRFAAGRHRFVPLPTTIGDNSTSGTGPNGIAVMDVIRGGINRITTGVIDLAICNNVCHAILHAALDRVAPRLAGLANRGFIRWSTGNGSIRHRFDVSIVGRVNHTGRVIHCITSSGINRATIVVTAAVFTAAPFTAAAVTTAVITAVTTAAVIMAAAIMAAAITAAINLTILDWVGSVGLRATGARVPFRLQRVVHGAPGRARANRGRRYVGCRNRSLQSGLGLLHILGNNRQISRGHAPTRQLPGILRVWRVIRG